MLNKALFLLNLLPCLCPVPAKNFFIKLLFFFAKMVDNCFVFIYNKDNQKHKRRYIMTMYEKADKLYGNDLLKKNSFLNACDALVYCVKWDDCGVDEETHKTIWKQAFHFIAEEEL